MGKRGFFFPRPRPRGGTGALVEAKIPAFYGPGLCEDRKRGHLAQRAIPKRQVAPKKGSSFRLPDLLPRPAARQNGDISGFSKPPGPQCKEMHVKCTMILGRARKSRLFISVRRRTYASAKATQHAISSTGPRYFFSCSSHTSPTPIRRHWSVGKLACCGRRGHRTRWTAGAPLAGRLHPGSHFPGPPILLAATDPSTTGNFWQPFFRSGRRKGVGLHAAARGGRAPPRDER